MPPRRNKKKNTNKQAQPGEEKVESSQNIDAQQQEENEEQSEVSTTVPQIEQVQNESPPQKVEEQPLIVEQFHENDLNVEQNQEKNEVVITTQPKDQHEQKIAEQKNEQKEPQNIQETQKKEQQQIHINETQNHETKDHQVQSNEQHNEQKQSKEHEQPKHEQQIIVDAHTTQVNKTIEPSHEPKHTDHSHQESDLQHASEQAQKPHLHTNIEVEKNTTVDHVPKVEVQSHNSCTIEGRPKFEVNKKQDDVHLESFKPTISEKHSESITIEHQPIAQTEQNIKVSLEKQSEVHLEAKETVVIEAIAQTNEQVQQQKEIHQEQVPLKTEATQPQLNQDIPINPNEIVQPQSASLPKVEHQVQHTSSPSPKPKIVEKVIHKDAETPTQQPEEDNHSQKDSQYTETPTPQPEDHKKQNVPKPEQQQQQVHADEPVIQQQTITEPVPQTVIQTHDSCTVQGLPQFEVNQKTDSIQLEQFVPGTHKNQVEQVILEPQSAAFTEQHQSLHLEKQPQAFSEGQESIIIQPQSSAHTQSNNQGSIEARATVEIQYSHNKGEVQQQPIVELEHNNSKLVDLYEHPQTNLSQNNDVNIEKHPEHKIDATIQQTTMQEHPQVQLQVDTHTEQTESQPIHQIQQTQQTNQIVQKPEQEIQINIEQGGTELSVQVEVQSILPDTQIEQKQVVQLEFNQQESILQQEEEKIIVVQRNETSLQAHPQVEILNTEERGSIEQKPELKTEQNTNPVQVSHNDDVKLEGYFAEKKEKQQQQQQPQKQKQENKQQIQSEILIETPQPDAEQQFIQQESSIISRQKSVIRQKVEDAAPDVGVIGLSMIAAAAASKFWLKKTASSKEGLLATVIGSAICYAGYKISTLRKTKSEIQQ